MNFRNLIEWTTTLVENEIPMQTAVYLRWYRYIMDELPPSFAPVLMANMEQIAITEDSYDEWVTSLRNM